MLIILGGEIMIVVVGRKRLMQHWNCWIGMYRMATITN